MKIAGKLGLVIIFAGLLMVGCQDDFISKETTVALKAAEHPMNSWIASKNTTRVNTDDAVESAVIVSQMVWMATNDNNRPGGVVLANPEDWRTAMVSADLIHYPNNGPVLFVNKEYIPELTLQELERLKPTGVEANNGVQVILVGDIGEHVENQVKQLGLTVDRITGENPADVAKQIDAYYAKAAGELPLSVLVGSMDEMAFTVPAVNWIAHMPEPLLYVTKNQIPKETMDALKKRGGKAQIYLLGPTSVISSNVAKQLEQYGRVVRIAGDNPYENAIAFAKYKDSETGFGWGITTPGHNVSFVGIDSLDLALGAAPFAHLGKHAPLLITEKERLPAKVAAYLMSLKPKYKDSPTEGPYNHAMMAGSKASISIPVQGEIDALMEIVSGTGAGHGGHGGHGGHH